MKYLILSAAIATLSAIAPGCGTVAGGDDGDVEPDAAVSPDAEIEVDAGNAIDEAPADNDSLQSPAESHFLSITGKRNFSYSDEVSFPAGDAEDFLEFEFPNNSNPNQVVRVTLECTITGQADAIGAARLFENEELSTTQVRCNDGEQTLTVDNTMVQVLRVEFASVAEPSHIAYTLTVVGFQ